jgi:uncharacterized protein (DUF1697 family)
MPKLIAFLRAVNVGGHTVTMAALRGHFEALGFTDVETFIASGNVIFSSSARDTGAIAKKIEARLHASLGYEVKTFIRTAAEVAAVAGYQPFTAAARESAGAFSVGFLTEPLSAEARKAVMALTTAIDDFHVQGREVYWICKKRQGESTVSNMSFEKAVKVRITFRNVRTVARLAARHS